MIPLITCETTFCQDVCKLVLGVDVFDLDLRIKINSIEQPIKSNSVVLETCLIVGFLLFIIILMTPSLSSKTYNRTSRFADWTFEGTKSMSCTTSIKLQDLFSHLRVAPWHLKHKKYFQRQKQLDPTIPEQANHPISVLCPQRQFQILLNCEKQLFVSCTSNLLEQMYDCQKKKKHNVPPEVDFESSRSPAKSESWNSPNLHCSAVFPTWQYCLYSLVWWIYEINRFRRLSHALVRFVMARASWFTDHKISGRPILAKYKHFRTIWEHVFDNSPTDFVYSSLKWWSSMHGADVL